MEHDIFISYAHHDDHTHRAWVQRFSERLVNDYRSRTGRTLNIFFDRDNLQTGQVLDQRLQKALAASAVFLPILSPAYLSSEWCRQELQTFVEKAGAGLVLEDGSSRLLPVRLMPYEETYDDAAAAEALSWLQEKELLYADFYKERLPVKTDEPLFEEKIAELSATLKERLPRLRQAGAPPPPDPAGGAAIFLANSSSVSQELRSSLLRELQQQRKYGKINLRLLPDEAADAPAEPEGLSAGQLEALTRQYVRESLFSIHLLDDLPGKKPAQGGEAVPQLQYRIAKEALAERPDFRLLTLNRSEGECADAQLAFLQGVEEDVLRAEQIDALPGSDLKRIKDYVLELIGQLKEAEERRKARAQEKQVPRVFLVHDHRDKGDELYNAIDDLMFGKRWEVLVPVFKEDDPLVDPDRTFRVACELSSRVVVLLRHGSTAWCNAIKTDLIKVSAENQQAYAKAICVADPHVEQRLREVRSHEFEVINCARPDYTARLLDFLNA